MSRGIQRALLASIALALLGYGRDPMPSLAGEKVALRLSDGRFLALSQDGWLRPGSFAPAEAERLDLETLAEGRVALRSSAGHLITPVAPDGRWLHVDTPDAQLVDRHKLIVLPTEGNRVAMRSHVAPMPVHFDLRARPQFGARAEQPLPHETVAIYRVSDVPAAIQMLLVPLITAAAENELKGKEYDRTRTKKIERYVEVWSPALNNLRHKKRHRILATEEQQRVQAALEGKPEIRITQLSYLRGRQEPGEALLMFAVSAKVPFRGAIGYKIPKVIDTTIRFLATAQIELVGEVRAEKRGKELVLHPPEVRDIGIELDLRHFSNDLLDAAREPIEDVANREIRANEGRIRDQANKALAKAVDAQEFRHPLLKYLMLP
ncbi:MAG: fascin domain-containing protein [Planctomycetota bacterium]